ncbi:MAG: hypothetical protein HYV51_00670 [Parcubacteria group bacterium]|nr:hypothetical protein [Parcubacteria group bacterium]
MFVAMAKTKIIVIGGILVLSIFVGLLIQISLRESQSKSKQTSAPIKLSLEFPKSPYSSKEFSTFKKITPEFLNIPTLPIPKPANTVTPFFENINEAVKAMEKSLTPDNIPTQKTATVTSAGIILSLTKDQFNFLYPNDFIASLIDAQTLFIKEYDSGYVPITKIETDAQVRVIEEKIVTTLLSANMITKERAEQFITTIRFTLPELQIIDLKRYSSYSFYKSLHSPPKRVPKGLFLAGFMKELTGAITHKAQAAVCGYCYSQPLCYQEGASIPNKAGAQVFKAACYCTGCLSSLGCLSSYEGQAAIYDQETGICGAGL